MKILYLLNAYAEDGPGLLISQIASLLALNEDVAVSSAALSRGGPLEARFEEKDIPTHIIGMKGGLDWKGYKSLIRFLRKGEYDVIHTNILRADLFGRKAARAAHVPLVISTEHGLHAWEYRGPMIRKLVKQLYLRTTYYTNMIIAVSDFVKNALIREGIPREKIIRIYNGVDTSDFTPVKGFDRDKLRRYITDEPVKTAIGLVGNLIEMKGLRYFIEALPLIFEKHPDTLVVVVGEGSLRGEMEAEVTQKGLSKRVKFLGHLTQLTRHIVAAMDILVQPSLTESFGLTAAEALSCEVPVVASDVGGLPELIEDGVCGYLVPPRDPEKLAEKVNDLLDNPEKRSAFGAAGRERTIKRFQIKTTAEQYYQLYKRFF